MFLIRILALFPQLVFDTGATITGTSPTDTANAYNFDNIAGVDPFTDTTDFNIGGFDTGPNVDTTAPSGLTGSTDLLGDPINLGTVSPTDQFMYEPVQSLNLKLKNRT
jgi:hypothetical protein